MGLPELLNHLLNLLLPAFVTGALVALFAPVMRLCGPARRSWLRQSVLNALAGSVAVLTGLWYFGHDAKMATYAGMLVLCASMQFMSTRGWK